MEIVFLTLHSFDFLRLMFPLHFNNLDLFLDLHFTIVSQVFLESPFEQHFGIW